MIYFIINLIIMFLFYGVLTFIVFQIHHKSEERDEEIAGGFRYFRDKLLDDDKTADEAITQLLWQDNDLREQIENQNTRINGLEQEELNLIYKFDYDDNEDVKRDAEINDIEQNYDTFENTMITALEKIY